MKYEFNEMIRFTKDITRVQEVYDELYNSNEISQHEINDEEKFYLFNKLIDDFNTEYGMDIESDFEWQELTEKFYKERLVNELNKENGDDDMNDTNLVMNIMRIQELYDEFVKEGKIDNMNDDLDLYDMAITFEEWAKTFIEEFDPSSGKDWIQETESFYTRKLIRQFTAPDKMRVKVEVEVDASYYYMDEIDKIKADIKRNIECNGVFSNTDVSIISCDKY